MLDSELHEAYDRIAELKRDNLDLWNDAKEAREALSRWIRVSAALWLPILSFTVIVAFGIGYWIGISR